MENYILSNGVAIPKIGLGTWHNTDEDTVADTLLHAISLGYTHIDTASVYGNEKFIGDAIIKSGVPRENLFMENRIWLPKNTEGF